MKRLFSLITALVLFNCLSFGQTKGNVGVDFMLKNEINVNISSLQTTIIPIIGIRFQPIDNLGIRGTISYVSNTTEQLYNYYSPTSGVTYDLTDKTAGLGIDSYYYVYHKMDLAVYTGLGFTYSIEKVDYVSSYILGNQPQIDNVTLYQRHARAFTGLQYSFNNNFAVFGEIRNSFRLLTCHDFPPLSAT